MQAIIMAAGKGSRLGDLTGGEPKSFLKVRGIKLIEYNLALLHACGIRDIVIVTGYRNEKLEALADGIEGVSCVYNPFYEMVNVLGSFYMAQEHLKDTDLIYMHADTLCAPEIMEDMLKAQGDMVLPVEYKPCDEEAMKVRTDGGNIIEISKQIPIEKSEGEFIGIAKISRRVLPDLKAVCKQLMRDKQFMSYFEGAVQELADMRKYKIRAVSTEGRFWGEIDFEEDYKRVRAEISQRLVQIAEKEFLPS